MIGRSSWVDSLFVWFPAAWMPLVVEAIREKSFRYCQSVSQLGAVALLTDHILSCRRHWSLARRLKGGRLMQGDAAQCYNHASMLTGSHLTRKCLLCKKEFSAMCSFRKRLWPGIMPLVIELW